MESTFYDWPVQPVWTKWYMVLASFGKLGWWFMLFWTLLCLHLALPALKYMTHTCASPPRWFLVLLWLHRDRQAGLVILPVKAPLPSCSLTPNSCQWFPAGCGGAALLGEEERSAGSTLRLVRRPRAWLNLPPVIPPVVPCPNPTPSLFV